MAEIIGARADAGRIEDHVRRTMRAALARGEDVAAAAQERLASAIAAIDAASELQTVPASAPRSGALRPGCRPSRETF